MRWLLWRQHRLEVGIVVGAVGLIAAVFGVARLAIERSYAQLGIADCIARTPLSPSCSSSVSAFNGQYAAIGGTDLLWIPLLPAVLGILIGAPLLAREFEQGTHRMIWMQSVTRLRWLGVKVGGLLVLTAVAAAALSLVLAWSLGDLAAVQQALRLGSPLKAPVFDVEGVVPVAYAIFALALGISAGAMLRRTVGAMVVVLVLFAAVRVPVAAFVRPNLEAPIVTMRAAVVSQSLPLDTAPPGSWFLDSGLVDAAGHRVAVPQCPTIIVTTQDLQRCYTERGYREFVTYQPADRFWLFQWTESSIYVVISALLLLVTAWYVRWRVA